MKNNNLPSWLEIFAFNELIKEGDLTAGSGFVALILCICLGVAIVIGGYVVIPVLLYQSFKKSMPGLKADFAKLANPVLDFLLETVDSPAAPSRQARRAALLERIKRQQEEIKSLPAWD